MVYQGVADYEYRNEKFPFRWGYGRSTTFSLYFFSLLSLSVFHVQKIYIPFCKNLIGVHEQSHHRELRSTRCIRQILLGGDSGESFCPCVLYERGLISVPFAILYWSEHCFCTPQNGKENLPFWCDVTQIRL